MTNKEFIANELRIQGFHVYRQFLELAEARDQEIDDLAGEMIWHSGLTEDTVLKATRGKKLPGTVHTLVNMVDGIGCIVQLKFLPIDDNDRTSSKPVYLTSTDPKKLSNYLASQLCALRQSVEQKQKRIIPASSLEAGTRSQTFAGLMRALATLGLKVRVYIVERRSNSPR